MVRIAKKRHELPVDVCPTDVNTPKDGCVFLKLRYDTLSVLKMQYAHLTQRLISLEVQKTDAILNAVAWRCMTYGDLYELIPEAQAEYTPQPVAQCAMKGSGSILKKHKAPKGFKYRQINLPDTEITVDVSGKSNNISMELC